MYYNCNSYLSAYPYRCGASALAGNGPNSSGKAGGTATTKDKDSRKHSWNASCTTDTTPHDAYPSQPCCAQTQHLRTSFESQNSVSHNDNLWHGSANANGKNYVVQNYRYNYSYN